MSNASQIGADKIIEFPAGLPGFENLRRFTFRHDEAEDPVVFLLQSVEQPDVSFTVTDPVLLGLDYNIEIGDEEEKLLDIKQPQDIAILLVLYRVDPADADSQVTANITAPLLVNLQSRRGVQKILMGNSNAITFRGQPQARE